VPGLLWFVELGSYSEIDAHGHLVIVSRYLARQTLQIKDIVRIYR
jgi:hypothetical protein